MAVLKFVTRTNNIFKYSCCKYYKANCDVIKKKKNLTSLVAVQFPQVLRIGLIETLFSSLEILISILDGVGRGFIVRMLHHRQQYPYRFKMYIYIRAIPPIAKLNL